MVIGQKGVIAMADYEKVIKGLMVCVDRIPGKYNCNECPYEIDGNYCEINLAKDAITLLNDQKKKINELEEKLRLLEYGDLDTLQSAMMPAT